MVIIPFLLIGSDAEVLKANPRQIEVKIRRLFFFPADSGIIK